MTKYQSIIIKKIVLNELKQKIGGYDPLTPKPTAIA